MDPTTGLLTDLTAPNVVAYLGLAVTLLVPVVTGLNAPAQVKAFAQLILSVLGATAYVLVNPASGGYDVGHFVLAFISVFVISGLGHVFVAKPLGLSDAINRVTAGVGVGAAPLPVAALPVAPSVDTSGVDLTGLDAAQAASSSDEPAADPVVDPSTVVAPVTDPAV